MGFKNDLYLSRKPLAGFVAMGVAWATYFAQMPVIKANVGASDGVYGIAILAASLWALLAMWLAPMCQRYLGGSAIPMGIAVIAVGMVSAGLSHTLVLLIVAMALVSLGSGVVDVLMSARISEIETASGRTLMNLNHAMYSFAYAGAALMTGVLREAQVPTAQIFGVLVVVLLALAWVGRDRLPALDKAEHDPAPMPKGIVVLVGLVVLVAFLAEASSEGWSALHIERTLGGSAGQGALGPALMGLMMGVGRLSGHAIAQWMRDTTLMLLACIVSACGLLMAGLAGSVSVALIGFALGGLGISVVAPLALALVGRVVPPDARLAAISRASVIGYAAFFFGPSLMGLVAEGFGLRAAFIVVAGLLAVVALVMLPVLARRTG